jgi:hypothetical protein
MELGLVGGLLRAILNLVASAFTILFWLIEHVI